MLKICFWLVHIHLFLYEARRLHSKEKVQPCLDNFLCHRCLLLKLRWWKWTGTVIQWQNSKQLNISIHLVTTVQNTITSPTCQAHLTFKTHPTQEGNFQGRLWSIFWVIQILSCQSTSNNLNTKQNNCLSFNFQPEDSEQLTPKPTTRLDPEPVPSSQPTP